jgi:hypothetical protein
MFSTSRASVALTAALLICLTACTPSETSSSGDETPTRTATATPTASATPEPAPVPTLPELSALVVSTEGLGPVTVGAVVPADTSPAAITSWDEAYCTSDGTVAVGDPYAGAWVPNYPESASPYLGTRRAFDIVTLAGERDTAIQWINVWAPEVSTAEGIHAGSTVDELLAAYPGFDEVLESDISTVYALNGSAGRLLFEVASVDETGMYADYWTTQNNGDQNNTVVWIRVTALDVPVAGIAGGDAGGPCIV